MSMKIDISNYEQYVLDYLEGSLEGTALEAFNAFLLTHPEIAAGIAEMAEVNITLSVPGDHASFKEELKIRVHTTAEIGEEDYESFFALAVGEKPESKTYRSVQEFLELNPALHKDFTLYQRTALEQNAAITFDEKASLTRPVPLFEAIPAMAYRIAAVLVIALGAYTAFQSIQDTVYSPRSGMVDFALLPMDTATAVNTETVLLPDVTEQALADATPGPGQKQRERIQSLPVMKVMLTPDPKIVVNHEMAAYEPSLPRIVPNEETHVIQGKAEELTLAQYVGKQLGIEPEQVPSTKALIRESVGKVIPHNEEFAINTQSGDTERNTFHILAGAFEFKRVTYKEN